MRPLPCNGSGQNMKWNLNIFKTTTALCRANTYCPEPAGRHFPERRFLDNFRIADKPTGAKKMP
jgi:hypothetical protein